MLTKFINWVKSFFRKPKVETFSGWIKDTEDSRDQIFTPKATRTRRAK